MFKRMIDQFDRLRRRNAFMEQYKKEKIFENSLAEFDDARYIAPAQAPVSADRSPGRLLKNSSRNIRRVKAPTIYHT